MFGQNAGWCWNMLRLFLMYLLWLLWLIHGYAAPLPQFWLKPRPRHNERQLQIVFHDLSTLVDQWSEKGGLKLRSNLFNEEFIIAIQFKSFLYKPCIVYIRKGKDNWLSSPYIFCPSLQAQMSWFRSDQNHSLKHKLWYLKILCIISF